MIISLLVDVAYLTYLGAKGIYNVGYYTCVGTKKVYGYIADRYVQPDISQTEQRTPSPSPSPSPPPPPPPSPNKEKPITAKYVSTNGNERIKLI